MNIFTFHKCTASSAEDHCDNHCNKMTIEYAQILSTVLRVYYSMDDYRLYQPTHQHGRFVKWAAASSNNFEWLTELFSETAKQYELRFGRTHATYHRFDGGAVFDWHRKLLPRCECVIPPPLGMPTECQIGDGTTWKSVTQSYRNYFNMKKQHIAKWKFATPEWYHA